QGGPADRAELAAAAPVRRHRARRRARCAAAGTEPRRHGLVAVARAPRAAGRRQRHPAALPLLPGLARDVHRTRPAARSPLPGRGAMTATPAPEHAAGGGTTMCADDVPILERTRTGDPP